MSTFDIITDHSRQKLTQVPENVLDMNSLRMLYLEGNSIRFLPESFFIRLPNLTWLDLRNNKLEDIPSNIADHKKLETLLVQNNNLEFLPNELGLLSTLQMLQISGNPLLYPPQDILDEGTKIICSYLKDQYEKILSLNEAVLQETDSEAKLTHNRSSTSTSKTSDKVSIREVLSKTAKSGNLSMATLPIISVKSLSKNENASPKNDGEGSGVIEKKHKVVRQCPKFTVKSQYMNGNKTIQTTMKIKTRGGRIDEQAVKEVWLAKLRELLMEQERLIQQEKNLRSLNEWRLEKKLEPERLPSEEEILIPPYATDSEYERILSREDLRKQFEKMNKNRKFMAKQPQPNIEKLMDDVLSQLKSLENQMVEKDAATPRTKIQSSESEIKAILDLHKRIAALQIINNGY